MSGFLSTLSPTPGAQVEAIYIAYYGRAADGGGYLYWQADAETLISQGLTADQAGVQIANIFSEQTESQANYAFLQSPPAVLNPNDPVQITSVDTFINQVYNNLFNHAADQAGLNYWQNAILKGEVTVGDAVYAIADGATGNDATILGYKVEAGLYFTTNTFAAGLGASPTTPPAVGSDFIQAATQIITPVVDATTEATAATQTSEFIAQDGNWPLTTAAPPPTEFTLTAGTDNFTTSTTGVIFNAQLQSGNSSGELSGGSSVNLQTLTVNNSLVDTAGDGTLNAVFNQSTNGDYGAATGTNLVVPNVTLQGVSTANLTVLTYANQGFQGSQGTSSSTGSGITGLVTVNDLNSLAGIVLGATGNGLNTALVNVNITGFSGGTGALLFAEYLNPKAGAATNTINVAVGGQLGNTTSGQADSLFFGSAANPGTSGAPNLSYGTWALTVNSAADLELWQNGVGAATELTLAGASPVALGEDAAGNWQKLTTIDASASTADVTITGHASADASNIGNLFLQAGASAGVGTGATGNNPYGLFGSAAGLLDGNKALTVYKFSTGVNFLDVSSDNQAALAKLVTNSGHERADRQRNRRGQLGCHHDLGGDLRRHQGLRGSRRHRHRRHHRRRQPADIDRLHSLPDRRQGRRDDQQRPGRDRGAAVHRRYRRQRRRL